jgi:hypothetical protein
MLPVLRGQRSSLVPVEWLFDLIIVGDQRVVLVDGLRDLRSSAAARVIHRALFGRHLLIR